MQATEANSQNSKISFGYVDSYAKIFLILYPSFENSTTRIAILRTPYCWTLNQKHWIHSICTIENKLLLTFKHLLYKLIWWLCWKKSSIIYVLQINLTINQWFINVTPKINNRFDWCHLLKKVRLTNSYWLNSNNPTKHNI